MFSPRNVLIACLVSVLSGATVPAAWADSEANKALIRDRWLPMIQTADQAIADEIFAPGFTCHAPHYPQAGTLAGYRVEVINAGAVVGDWQVVLEDLIAEGDTVVGRFTASGKMPPAGIFYTNTWIIFYRFEDGKIAEEWWQYDLLGVQQQLGAIEPARPTPEDYRWGPASEVTGDPGTPEANEQLIMRFVNEVWNAHSTEPMDELCHPDVVAHNPPINYVYGLKGREILKGSAADYLNAFPDLYVTADDIVLEGDKAAVRWTFKGTHNGDLTGLPATGRPVRYTGITMYRFADGKIVEMWWDWDMLAMMMQLTAEEWSFGGPWITSLPSPMGNMLVKGIWTAQDEQDTRFTGEFEHINVYPLLLDLYPDMDAIRFAGAVATRTVVNELEMTALEYFTSEIGPGHEEIVGIAIITGTVQLTGPNEAMGTGTGAYYLAAQDADQDGFPDEGEEPALCYPWQWTARRLTPMPPCTPTPVPEP